MFRNPDATDCSFFKQIVADFKSVNIFWLFVICVLFMLSNLFRALRWNQFLEPLGYKPRLINSLGTIMIGYFANLAVPRIGEVVRAGSMSKYENIDGGEVFGTIVLDRLLDVISLLTVIALAFILSFTTFQEYFSENFKLPSTFLIYFVIVGGILGLIGLYFFNRILQNNSSQNKWVLKIQKLWQGFKDGISSITKVKNLPLMLFYSFGIWFLYYLMTYLCFFGFEPTSHLGPIAGLVVFVFGSLGMVLPSPGGIGSYQWLVTQALIIYGIDKFAAFSFATIIFMTIQISCNILFGIIFWVILPQINKKP